MALRVIILLGCVALFINGCNNLISGFTGTHKLRSYEMDAVLSEGIGDADYIEIVDSQVYGEHVFQLGGERYKRPLWLFPVLSAGQMEALDKGEKVEVKILGWTEKFDPDCSGGCLPRGEWPAKGVVVSNRRVRNAVPELNKEKFMLTENPIYIQVLRKPIAWYWNAAMTMVALLVAYFLERRNFNRKNTNKQNE